MIRTKVSELEKGDMITLESGLNVTIIEITPGMIGHTSKLLTYSNGEWSNVHNNDTVEVLNRYTHAQVVAYICDNGHRGLNCTGEEFRSLYESFGFTRSEESGKFTHPTLSPDKVLASYDNFSDAEK